jgi:hypothetical protein
LFFSACSKPEPGSEAEGIPESGGEGPVLEETGQSLHGVILTEAGLWELRADGKIYWKSQLNAGDTVNWNGEQQSYHRNYDNAVRNFYRVEADGDYWVQDYAIAGPAEPGVVVAPDTVLYTKPDPTSPVRAGNVSLPQYTLVAVFPDEDPTDNYIKVSARLEGTSNPPISERYVKVENVSTDPNDIGAVKLARIASATENAVVRAELLRNALDIARQSRFLSRTAAELGGEPAFFELELTDNLEQLASRTSYMVTSDTVNIRDIPAVSGKVVATLNQGDTLWVSAKTKRETTLAAPEGEEKPKGAWFKTDNGWVFGAYIALNPLYD